MPWATDVSVLHEDGRHVQLNADAVLEVLPQRNGDLFVSVVAHILDRSGNRSSARVESFATLRYGRLLHSFYRIFSKLLCLCVCLQGCIICWL